MGGRMGKRAAALAGLLDAIVEGRLVAYLDACEPADDGADAWTGGLRVLALTLSLRWIDATAYAATIGPAQPDDPDARWLLLGATAWAASGDPAPGSPDLLDGPLDGLLDADLPDPSGVLGRFAGYLLVEAALAHARLDLADRVAARLGPALWSGLDLGGPPHPFHTMMLACRVRLLAFRGDIAQADAVRRTFAAPGRGPITALAAATECLVRGNDADPADVRRLAALVDEHVPETTDLLAAGSQMLTAFGLVAVGEVAEAARRVLLAGGGPGLECLNVIDRALGLELLVVLALEAGDLDAAEAWQDRAALLLASPIADSTAARLHSRVALAGGRVDEATAWAERAVARAREVDRLIEYAEGEIVLSRARILQRGPGGRSAAAQALQAMVAEAELRGHRAARAAASRELRPIGLRLRPQAGSGWEGLTAREAEVARLVADGAPNKAIAARLHVSEHTVRAHVSRVLAAFAVATRSALPAALGAFDVRSDPATSDPATSDPATSDPATSDPAMSDPDPSAGGVALRLAQLTARQCEVAHLVSRGLSNRDIADHLAVSIRTVEKHVGDILQRWDLAGRTAIARVVAGSPEALASRPSE